MKQANIHCRAALVASGFLCAAQVGAATYTIENLATGSSLGGAGGGQTFTPADAIGYSGEAMLALKALTLWRGGSNNAATQTSVTTYLAIYDGNPDTASQITVSSNFVDTANTGAGAQYDWTFEGLMLDASTRYWAVLSNSPVDDNVLQSAGGTWLQMSLQTSSENYGGTDEWALIANRDPHNATDKPDLRFSATFDSVPEPSTQLMIALAGGALAFSRRRARAVRRAV